MLAGGPTRQQSIINKLLNFPLDITINSTKQPRREEPAIFQLGSALEIGHQTGNIRASEFAVAVDIRGDIKVMIDLRRNRIVVA